MTFRELVSKIKNNLNLNYSIKVVLTGIALIALSLYFSWLDRSTHKKSDVSQTQPAPSPVEEEIKLPPDTSGWQLYDKHGLKFRHPPNWSVGIPGESFTFGNDRIWSIDDMSEGSPLIYLLIHRSRRYTPLPGSDDILTGHLVETFGGQERMEFSQKSNDWQEFTFKGRKAIKITNTSPWQGHPRVGVFISIPEESGILAVDFSWSQQPFDQAVKDYFEPFLESLEIKLDAWPKPGTYLSLTPSSQLNTSSWKTYQGESFSLRYPESWWAEKEEREYESTTTIVVSKFGGEKIGGKQQLPQVFIGRSTIFSTSGAICANEPYCKEIGEAEIKTKDNNYFATIYEKKLFFGWKEGDDYEKLPSYYVVSGWLDRMPSKPTVTALYKTVAEGQEIVNILSTISY